MMVMYYWLVFLIIFTKSQTPCDNDEECKFWTGEICCGTHVTECCLAEQCCDQFGCCPELKCCDYTSAQQYCCDVGQLGCYCDFGDEYNNAQKNSEMQDGSVNKTVAHNYYDNWWIIIAIVAVIMVVCCGGVALCWLKKVKVKAYGHVGKENEAVEEEMELQETQS
eukprot:420269_1